MHMDLASSVHTNDRGQYFSVRTAQNVSIGSKRPDICLIAQNEVPTIGNLNITSLLYADDLVLVSKTKQGLQNLLNTLEKYTTDCI